MTRESQGQSGKKSDDISILGHGTTENTGIALQAGKNSYAPLAGAGMRTKGASGGRRHFSANERNRDFTPTTLLISGQLRGFH
jgi:hypothetical protein